MSKILDNLNAKQKEACLIVNGPVMVIAGAGSGKTRVLTERIAYLIDEVGIPPFNILAITFTNKAAKEMKGRISGLLDDSVSSYVWCATFHSICSKILRSEITRLGYKNNFAIVDDDDSLAIIKEVIKELDYDPKNVQPKIYAGMISKVKSLMVKIDDYDYPVRSYLETVYEKYNKYLFDNNMVDFDDLIYLTIKIFKEYPQVLEKYQDKFQYILVDEFQDTSNIQYDLCEMLARKHQNIFIVGDEDQSIYSFRGANILNIKKFMRDFKNYKQVVLTQNYRSNVNILDAANALICHNKVRIHKDLWSDIESDELITHYQAYMDREESFSIIKKIEELVENEGYQYSDIAILYRNNYLSRSFEDELLKARIPYQIYSGISFYKRKEVKDMLSYLRLIINDNDVYSFNRVVNVPKRGIGSVSIQKITDYMTDKNVDLFTAIEQISSLKSDTKDKLLSFKEKILGLREKINEMELIDFYKLVLEETGYNTYLSSLEKEERKMREENIQELCNMLVLEMEDTNYENLAILLQDLSLKTDLDLESNDPNHVSLMTMHTAKGLEFKVVFVTCMEETIIPGFRERTSESIEEERRVFYVAITRAKEKLFISNSGRRYIYGREVDSMPSPFLKEIPKELVKEEFQFKKTVINQKAIDESKPKIEVKVSSELKIGDKVIHDVFGRGVVVTIENKVACIAFSKEYGIKKLMVGHQSYRKE